jgi:predicted metal-dependent phosphoesterase TrpH
VVDLHAHSTASDGSKSPTEFVEAAARVGLTAVALTDHDTLGGVPEAMTAGVRLGVDVIAGVELSTYDGDREMHMLGLHIQRVGELDRELDVFRSARHLRAERIVTLLNGLGIPVTFDAVLAIAAGAAIGRPHIARALVEGAWVPDIRTAFDRYLGYGRPAFVDKRRLTTADGIRLIHESGGIAVLAHPGPEGRRERVEPLVRAGLDGLEVRHPGHSADDIQRIGALVQFFSLVPSGGSDWHGAPDGPRALGGMAIPKAWLDEQRHRVATRRATARVA